MRRPLLCFLVLGCALLWATRSRVAEASGYDLTGRRAPDFHIESGLHGISAGQTLASFRGEVVVVKFFFSGCPACRASLPEYEELHRRYAGRPVRFIGIADDSYANVERLFESSGYTFPVGIDPSGVTSASYGVRSYPTHYVIGTDGIVKAYDLLDSSVIDREVAEAVRVKNVEQLGAVPAALDAARDAAALNDYGEVLRIVEPHLDAAKYDAAVVAAARRIQAIAKERYQNRVRRVNAYAAAGWVDAAWHQAVQVAQDFHSTSLEADARALAASLERRLRGG